MSVFIIVGMVGAFTLKCEDSMILTENRLRIVILINILHVVKWFNFFFLIYGNDVYSD